MIYFPQSIRPILILCFLLLIVQTIHAQEVSNSDSITWKYNLPIWGKKATEKGYKLGLASQKRFDNVKIKIEETNKIIRN